MSNGLFRVSDLILRFPARRRLMSVINQLTATRQTRGDSAPGKTTGPHATFQSTKREFNKDVKPILAARNVFKSYRKGKLEVPVLRGVDFSIRPGEFTAVIG